MKNLFLTVILAAVIPALLVSCHITGDDPAKPIAVDQDRVAAVSGKIRLNTNGYSLDKPTELPSGSVTIEASVKLSDISGNPKHSSMRYTVNASYNTKTGEYLAFVPVGIDGSNIFVDVLPFDGTVHYRYTYTPEEEIEYLDVIWIRANRILSANPGDEITCDFNYYASDYDFTHK